MNVVRLVAQRVAWLIPQLLGISLVTFCVVRVVPANPAYLLAGPTPTPESVKQIISDLGLDRPLYIQYLDYTGRLLRGDLGMSWVSRRPVAQELADRLPATLELAFVGLAVGLVLGVGIGALSALTKGKLPDHVLRLVSLVSLSMPRFWLALLLVFVLYYELRLAPAPLGRLPPGGIPPTHITGFYILDSLVTGNFEALRASVSELVLPVMTTSFIMAGPIAKTTRAAMIELLSADYVLYARACGLPKFKVWAYAIRGALLPVITNTGVVFSTSLGGSVLTETVLGWPGISRYSVQAVNNSDYNVVQGFVVLVATLTVLVFVAVDLLYAVIDPRVRT